MLSIVTDFLNITGAGTAPPADMAELIPYLLTVFVGVALVVSVFRVIGSMAKALLSMRRP